MTTNHEVRDMLCKMRTGAYGKVVLSGNGPRVLTDSAAFALTPQFVNALRAAYYAGIDDDSERPHSDRGVTAGIEEMTEMSKT